MSTLFIMIYIQTTDIIRLPSMLPRIDAQGMEIIGMSEGELIVYETIMNQLLDAGIPMLEGLLSMPLDEPYRDGQMEIAKDLLGNLPIGITHFVLHPSIDTA